MYEDSHEGMMDWAECSRSVEYVQSAMIVDFCDLLENDHKLNAFFFFFLQSIAMKIWMMKSS